jgi:hypothetical protein
VPFFRFTVAQPDRIQNRGEITPRTDLLLVRYKLGNRRTILEQHKRDVLVMDTIDAVGEVSRGFRDSNRDASHKIRFSVPRYSAPFAATD